MRSTTYQKKAFFEFHRTPRMAANAELGRYAAIYHDNDETWPTRQLKRAYERCYRKLEDIIAKERG